VVGGDGGIELLVQGGLVGRGPFQGGRGHLVPSGCDGDRSFTDRMVGNECARRRPTAQAPGRKSLQGLDRRALRELIT
jgi:hypothetical protein